MAAINPDTQQKWDRIAPTFDVMAGKGPERRWRPVKQELFSHMNGNVLFMALGTGLDIQHFPPGKTITAIDISPKMLEQAQDRIKGYNGTLTARQMDVHALDFPDDSFDQVFTSCTFCSVPDPVAGLMSVKRVLKPGGDLYMFEHTGSRVFPLNIMGHVMTAISRRVGPDMNRPTVANVKKAGFVLREVHNIFLDVVKTIHAVKPPA